MSLTLRLRKIAIYGSTRTSSRSTVTLHRSQESWGGDRVNPETKSRWYLVSERKLGFFVQIKEDENFNRRNTLSISRIKI